MTGRVRLPRSPPLTSGRARATKTSCIDQIGQTAGPAHNVVVADLPESGSQVQSQLFHYVVVRQDLPPGNQIAQVLHAAGESAEPRPEPGCVAVALHARDLAHLLEIRRSLVRAGLAHHVVVEAHDDPRWPGQAMAIGLRPTGNRAAIRKVLSSLPLVR